jgi:hypothetical protein
MLSAGTFLLAASAGAQIKSTVVPYTPPAENTPKADNSKQPRTTEKTARSGAANKAPAKDTGKADDSKQLGTTEKTARRGAADAAPAAAAPPPGTPPAADAQPQKAKVTVGPGQNIGADGNLRTCDPDDPSPEGTVIDGYRKERVQNPIAPRAHFCQWRAVK